MKLLIKKACNEFKYGPFPVLLNAVEVAHADHADNLLRVRNTPQRLNQDPTMNE